MDWHPPAVLHHHPLHHRLYRRPGGAEIIDNGMAAPAAGRSASTAAADAVRRSAQRDGAQGLRPGGPASSQPGRAQHLCAVLHPGGHPAALAMAPMPDVVWQVDSGPLAMADRPVVPRLDGCSSPAFLINHFGTLRPHRVANNLTGRPMPAPRFYTPLFYPSSSGTHGSISLASSSPSGRRLG